MTTGWFELDDDGGAGGEVFAPRPTARSPWSAEMLHGRLLGGLAARAVERDHGDPALQPARCTVDLFRSPPMTPVTVTTERVRDGSRIRVVDALVSAVGGEPLARASVLLLRRTEEVAGDVWGAGAWDLPAPEDLPASPAGPSRMTEIRSATGRGSRGSGQKRVWLRDAATLLDGEPISPFVRATIASDYASPLANSGSEGLNYINADITLYLSRLPVGEWIGFEVGDHQSADGVAIAHCRLHDGAGPLGFTEVCAVANRMRR